MQCLQKILLIPDCHFPYHDKKAWKLLLKAGRHFKPDILVTLGDFFDMYAVSAHDRDPTRVTCLEQEIEEGKKGLKQLIDLGASRNIFIAGNHEHRLERYLMKKAPELFNTVKIERVLQLQEIGFKYVPYKDYIRIGKLYLTHDLGKSGKTAHEHAMDEAQHNIVIGHTHRLSYTVKGSMTGETHVGIMAGWLGDPDQIDYKHKARVKRESVHGFVTGYLNKRTGHVHLVPIPIVAGTCVVEGTLL